MCLHSPSVICWRIISGVISPEMRIHLIHSWTCVRQTPPTHGQIDSPKFGIRGLHTARQKRHPVVQIFHPQSLQPSHSFSLIAVLVPGSNLRFGARQGHGPHIRNHNHRSSEVVPIPGLKHTGTSTSRGFAGNASNYLNALNILLSQDHFDAPRDAAPGELSLRFLDPHFLKVHKHGLVQVQHEPRPVVADRVATYCWVCVLKPARCRARSEGRAALTLNCCSTFLITV